VAGGFLKTARRIWLGVALVSLGVGLFVSGWGLTLSPFKEIAVLGVPFLILGAIFLRVAQRMPGAKSTSSTPGSPAS
jgi:hypothetical protein